MKKLIELLRSYKLPYVIDEQNVFLDFFGTFIVISEIMDGDFLFETVTEDDDRETLFIFNMEDKYSLIKKLINNIDEKIQT